MELANELANAARRPLTKLPAARLDSPSAVAGSVAGRRSVGDDAGDGDGFKPRMNAESREQAADVVANRGSTQMQLGCDLLRRAALLQKTKHFDLAGGEMRRWGYGSFAGEFLHKTEDADHSLPARQSHGADLYGKAFAARRDQDAACFCGGLGAENLLSEPLLSKTLVLRRND
jgi:hypothetical protein